jgi:Uncharacterized protein conserved in bacteria
MDGREGQIVSEMLGICEDLGLELRVICCDCEVQSDRIVSSVSDLVYQGGGGSDFRPAFALLEEQAFDGVIVAFTDGDIPVPQHPPVHAAGVLWGIWDVDSAPAAWGGVVRIDSDRGGNHE